MATRSAFFIKDEKVVRKGFEITFSRNPLEIVRNLHETIIAPALEVSSISENELGQKLATANLSIGESSLDAVFHGSKVFEHGGPYYDILAFSPKKARNDSRLNESGELLGFYYDDMFWNPYVTSFFDYLYYKSISSSIDKTELNEIKKFVCFTDKFFNPQKRNETPARSITLVKLVLRLYGELIELTPQKFLIVHEKFVTS